MACLVSRIALAAAAGLSFAPFAAAAESAPATAAPAAAPGPLTIVVYDQPNYKGRALSITAATPNLAAVKFDDQIASVAITGAGDWVLCEHKNYAGRCARVQGSAENLKLFNIVGRVSSLYPVPAPAAAAAPAPAKP